MIKGYSLKKSLLAAILAGTLAMTTVLSGCGAFNKESDSKSSGVVSTDSQQSGSVPIGESEIVVSSEHYRIPRQVAYFLFNNTYNNRRDSAVYQGLDVTKSLKDQYYNEESQITWYDVFMDETKRYMQQVLVLCEAAAEEKMTLDDTDRENVETTINGIKSAASSLGITFEQYILEVFGEGVTEQMIREFTELTTLANKYYLKKYEGFRYTDADYEKYYNENKTSYQYADFISYSFSFSTDSETSTDEAKEKAAKEKAKAYADDLAKCKTEKEFKDYVRKYLKNNPSLVISTTEGEMTAAQLESSIDETIDKLSYEKYAYEVTSSAGKWLFDESRKNNDTTVIENANSYLTIMVTKSAYRDETVTKNVRHILFTADSYKSDVSDGNASSSDSGNTDEAADKKAEAKAKEVYESWKAGEKTEESFAKLAEQYSEDTGSKTNGGLYEDVTEGMMVPEFNDWLFDSKRKPGDTDIVKTTYGYHIMYFVSDGVPSWQLSVDTVLRKSDFDALYAELMDKYTVEFHSEVLQQISEAEIQETSGVTYQDDSASDSTETDDASEQTSAETTESADQQSTESQASKN